MLYLCSTWLVLSESNRELEGKYSDLEAIYLEIFEKLKKKFRVVV